MGRNLVLKRHPKFIAPTVSYTFFFPTSPNSHSGGVDLAAAPPQEGP